jgi:5-methylcytosine-specific restriction endonuclease McrA
MADDCAARQGGARVTDTRILRSLRRQAAKRQGGLCHYCQLPMTPCDGRSPASETLDHIVPVSAGGRSNPGNVVAACFTCNQVKADSCQFAPKPVTRRKRRRKSAPADATIIEARQIAKMMARRSLGRRR